MTTILYAVLVLSVMGAAFAALLGVAAKVFAVEVDPARRQFWNAWPAQTAAAAVTPAAQVTLLLWQRAKLPPTAVWPAALLLLLKLLKSWALPVVPAKK